MRPWSQKPLLVAACLLVATAFAVPAGAQRTPGLDEARARLDRLTQELADAESQLSQLELETLGARSEADRLEGEATELSADVAEAAILDFTRSGSAPNIFVTDDLTSAIRAGTLTDAAVGADTDALENYRVLFEDLAVARSMLNEAKSAQDAAVAALLATREEIGAELAKLEEIERARLAELRRKAAEEAARQAAIAAANGSSGGGSGGSGGAVALGGGLLKVCPVGGAHSFIDSWGAPRSSGRRHKGVDMLAAVGTPILAPVSGSVSHRSNRVGGRSFHLNGNDGNYYYGTHLSGYGNSGSVQVGDVIGYVGDDGNARGIPHLHFEIHPGGGGAVNPYPYVREVC